MRCGLLGEKLGHSYSPELHAFFGDYDYELFEVPRTSWATSCGCGISRAST